MIFTSDLPSKPGFYAFIDRNYYSESLNYAECFYVQKSENGLYFLDEDGEAKNINDKKGTWCRLIPADESKRLAVLEAMLPLIEGARFNKTTGKLMWQSASGPSTSALEKAYAAIKSATEE